ncbi:MULTISPECIES: alpha/beta hydrolase [Alcaligenes]|uniref:Alpha/beta hydrolase n=1 Tax=Alcaligenes ammonioxydans TaxID=2582914 RepID=A0ABX8SWH0_9BURK|nr:alpha/beta hydrolase [Alcaligenes ammonioxydans]QBH19325.1 alpha/beta hydrolase [Alcaligenes faecalis]QXX80387.1 alpha/beta hydrolase [Alcaligenes ammonioxydans]
MTQIPNPVFSPQDREREYSPSSCIGGNYAPYIEQYATLSKAALVGSAHHVELAYGDAAAHKLDLFLPAGTHSESLPPLLLFIHGGYWQELSKASSSFSAPDCTAAGIAFAALDYTLAPQACVHDMVLECRKALRWLHQHGNKLGFDPQRMVVSGSSAGAHLAAMCCLRGWEDDADLPLGTPAAAVLVSGIYDLQPLIGTSINDALSLDAASARAVSPQLLDLTGFPPTLIGWGEIETSEFKRQSQAFADLLKAQGAQYLPPIEMPGRNHFDVIFDQARPDTRLGAATHALFASLPVTSTGST